LIVNFAEVELGQLREPQTEMRSIVTREGLDELKESIRRLGVVQPLVVRDIGGGEYEIIAGHRRYLAAVELGLERVPCVIQDEVSDEVSEAMKVAENLQREDVNALDLAYYLDALINRRGWTVSQVAAACGQSDRWVYEKLALVEADPEIQGGVRSGALSPSVARVLMRCKDPVQREYLTRLAVDTSAPVRTVEEWVAKGVGANRSIETTGGTGGAAPELEVTEDQVDGDAEAEEEPNDRANRCTCDACKRRVAAALTRFVLLCPDCVAAIESAQSDGGEVLE
jgi:ParB/RepB/Spo0J family partition protein